MNKIDSFHIISFISILIVSILTYFEIPSSFIVLAFKDVTIGLIVIAMAFSLFFGRSKPFVLLLVPLFFYLYMFYPIALGLDGGTYSFWYLFPVATSLSFLFIGMLQERGLFCFYGAFKLLIVIVILAITYYFLKTFSIDLRRALDSKILGINIPLKVNDFTFIISLLSATLVTVITTVMFKNRLEKSIFWVLFALLIPALFFGTKSSFILFSVLSSSLILIALLKDAHNMAYIDTLTQIPARRALEESFLKLGNTYSIAMVDIDFFKKFNDTYGHDTGDEVLKLVAEQLSMVKGGGKAFRYGGEEFTILFKNKTNSEVKIYLENVREAIQTRKFVIRDEDRPNEKPENIKKTKIKDTKSVELTVSIGVANAPIDGKKPEDIMKRADVALYEAKDGGRNCVKTS